MADDPIAIYRRRLREMLASIKQGERDLESIHAEISRDILARLRALDPKPKEVYQVAPSAQKRVAELNQAERQARKAGQAYGRYTLTEVPVHRVALRPVWQESKLPPIRKAIADKTPLPPVRLVMLENGQLDIQDGIHRVNAAIEAGHTHIPAIVEEYIPKGAKAPPPLQFVEPAPANVNATQLEKEFRRVFEKSTSRRSRAIQQLIKQGAGKGPEVAKETMRAVLGEEAPRTRVRSSKSALNEAAERIAGRTTVDGKSVSRRLRGVDKQVSTEMAREVERGIQQKKGILGAARKIEKLDPRDVRIPVYLREMRDAAKAGDVDELKRLTKRHATYIERLGEIQPDLTKKASKYSVRAATKRFVADIEKAGPKGVDAIVGRYVKERAAFRANTIARHETVEAFRRTYIEESKTKPGVYGMKWVLSTTRHKVADECDVYANQNAYGLGPGVYPVDKVPKNPHPNCICSVVIAFDRKHFRRQRADNDNAPPEELRDDKSPDALAWLKGNDAAAAKILGPTRHQMLKEGVDVLDAEGKPRLVKDLLGQVGVPKVAPKVAAGGK